MRKRTNRSIGAPRWMRAAAAIGGGVALLGLAGCGSPAPSVSSAEAIEGYAPLLDDVQAALEEAFPEVVWTRDGDLRVQRSNPDDACTVVFPTLESAASLWGAAGGWDPVTAVLDQILAEHDFPALAEDDLQGGWTGVSAVDDDGAEIQLMDKSLTQISVTVDVTDAECDAP